MWPGAIRWIFILFIIAGYFFTYGLLRLFGIRDFFLLLLSAGFIIFLAIIAISLFLYRPFCRFICPFGALASVPAMGSRFKIRRTDACISCGKCERACPTNEAKRDDRKGECYLCHRCLDVCPVEGALEYRRTGENWGKKRGEIIFFKMKNSHSCVPGDATDIPLRREKRVEEDKDGKRRP